ncbi:MAG: choice-of-anchor D domain-containing protein [Verrucomicrobiota bacterium]
MKIFPLAAAVFISALAPAFAITDAEIVPSALAGRTLTFTIVNGSAPYATNGTWSGAFAASGNAFAVTRITGDTVNISTTFSAALNGTFTEVSLAKFIEGQNPAVLTLYTMGGVGNWEVAVNGLFGTGLNGTFTFATAAKVPEIDVLHDGDRLTDGSAKVGFGKVKIGKASPAEKIVIKNAGKAKLTGIGISKNGPDKGSFAVTALPKTSLAPGESMTVKVTFKPTSKGSKSAAIHISSNDGNESPFDIKLLGTGVK